MTTEYKIVPLESLQPFLIRDRRDSVLQQLRERIKATGYNPARPLTVVPQNGHYIVADGNHRLKVLADLGIKEVPVVIRDDDPYTLAVRCNCDEDTYAPMDLFDWLDFVKALKNDGFSLSKIALKIGWGESKVEQYSILTANIPTKILDICKKRQMGRVGDSPTDVGMNFTEGWFRTSGLYGLRKWYQYKTIEDYFKSKEQVQKLTKRYAWHQKLKSIVIDNLSKEAGLKAAIDLFHAIDRDNYGGNLNSHGIKEEDLVKRLEDAIALINEKATGTKLYLDDALLRIAALENKSIQLVVTDPPYNITSNEWDKFESPEAYLNWIGEWLKLLKPKLADEYHLFMFCDPEYMARIEQLLINQGWPIKSRIIWTFRNLVKGRDVTDKFISTWQPIFHCGTHSLNWSSEWNGERFDVQEYATPQSNFTDAKYHPTSKPAKLIELFVKVGSKPGDFVLDPFAGGGVTGEACINIKQRRCVLIEKQEQYVKIIEQRLKIRRVDE